MQIVMSWEMFFDQLQKDFAGKFSCTHISCIRSDIIGTDAGSTKQLKRNSADKQLLESVLLAVKLCIKVENFVVNPVTNGKQAKQ